MFPKISCIFLLCLLTVSAIAQSSRSSLAVIEDGKEVFLPDSINTKIKADSSQIEQTLLQWYSARGFLKAQIDSLSNKSVEINKGCQFALDDIRILYSGEIDSSRVLQPGIEYSQQALEREIRLYILNLEEQGYLFSSSRITDFDPDFDRCTVSISLRIETGQKVSMPDIYFAGAESNSQDYLRKVSRFRSPDALNPEYLRLLESNLNASELFSRVSEGQIFMRDGEPLIIFEVEERSLNQFDGLLGYVPNSAGEGQIMGKAELALWNALLQGNGFHLRYQRLKPETSKLDLGISQDWIGNIPVGVEGTFQLQQNDTTYQARAVDVNGYYQLLSGFKLTGGIGLQTTTSGTNVPRVVEPDGSKQIARLGFEYTSLNNYEVPTSGSRVSISLAVANKDLDDDSLAAFTQNTLQFAVNNYLPIFSKGVIASSLNVFFLDAERVTVHDLIQFGGANSLRGYAEEQFRAGTMVWGDVEFRYLLNPYSYLFTFAAIGGYERPRLLTESDDTFQTVDYLYSAGFGLSYRTPIGVLKFTYALSPEESIQNGKVHFGIRTSL